MGLSHLLFFPGLLLCICERGFNLLGGLVVGHGFRHSDTHVCKTVSIAGQQYLRYVGTAQFRFSGHVITFHAIACATLTAMMQLSVKGAVILASLIQLAAFGLSVFSGCGIVPASGSATTIA